MLLKKIYFIDVPEENDEDVTDNGIGIPADDGHQMSQSEIDNLIAMLLKNQ